MGKLKDKTKHMVTMYLDRLLYEQIRVAAYMLGENIYTFVEEAARNAITRRLDKTQRNAVELTANQNLIHGGSPRRQSGQHTKFPL